MNTRETQQLLSMIWSMFPNAPKLTKDDKTVMVMSWLSLLHEYSVEDVWKAVKRCIDREPRFVPTAPEVMKNCFKNVDVEHYLPANYEELSETIDRSFSAVASRNYEIKFYRDTDKDQLTPVQAATLQRLEHEREIERKLNAMWAEALSKATAAYDRREKEKLRDDGTIQRLNLAIG